MSEHKTPDWLIETQNKSWEPEILISGITLTFLFILPVHIYNFYGMLIQDFGVFERMISPLYVTTTVFMKGVSIVLITHLVLRGLWTGLVGLSYVYPQGINKDNLAEAGKKINFPKPDELVIKLERICSQLFSFIFSLFPMFFGFFLLLSPIVFLFIFGLDVLVLRANPLIFIIGAIVIIVVGTLLFEKKFKNSKITMAMKTSTLNTSFLTLASNLGEKKIYPIIVLYCIISFSLSIYEIVDFDFENTKSIKKSSETNLVKLREESYETKRNTKLRIQKAAIESFEVTDNTIRLFISYYKEDKFTVKNIETNPELFKNFSSDITDSIQVSMPDLYGIYIDEEKITDLTWYKIRKKSPNQKGFVTMIPLDNIENGSHILKIDKIHWAYDKKQFKIIEDWDLIPFEKQIVPL